MCVFILFDMPTKRAVKGECLVCKGKILRKKHLVRKHLSQCPQAGEDLKSAAKKMKPEDKSANTGQRTFQIRQPYCPQKSWIFLPGQQPQCLDQGATPPRHGTRERRGLGQLAISGDSCSPYFFATLLFTNRRESGVDSLLPSAAWKTLQLSVPQTLS